MSQLFPEQINARLSKLNEKWNFEKDYNDLLKDINATDNFIFETD